MSRTFLRTSFAAISLLIPGMALVPLACSSSPDGESGVDASAEADTSTVPQSDTSTQEDSSTRDASVDASVEAMTIVDASAPDTFESGNLGPQPFFDAGDCGVGPSGEPITLACTGLYSDWASKTVATSNVEYDPGLHFWSDGADKTRWYSLPPGTKIDTSNMDEWIFPVGTRFWKEFRIPIGDGGAFTRIETRLLWKTGPQTWYRTTYLWSADGESNANELTSGELDAGGIGYEVPTAPLECNQCHNGRKDGILGFEAVALSTPEATPVTIGTLNQQGLITAAPAKPIVIPGNETQSTALAWFHTNCGVPCHNANGEAEFTGFYMRLDVDTLTSVETTDTYQTGWNVETANYDIPDARPTYRLHACSTGTSCAYFRDSHRDGVNGTVPGTQMPPIDTHKVDTTDMANIAAWINMGCDAGDGG